MSAYLEARKRLIQELEMFASAHTEYLALVENLQPGQVAQELPAVREWAAAHQVELRTRLLSLTYDLEYQRIVGAEPALSIAMDQVNAVWNFFTSSGLMAAHDVFQEQTPVVATVPPDVPVELTGANVTDFAKEFHTWLVTEAKSLWEGEDVLPLPKIDSRMRYMLGDFVQTQHVCQLLAMCTSIRYHWLELMSHGQFWDSVSVGAAKARLLVKGVAVLKGILQPVTEEAAVAAVEACKFQ